MKKKVLSVLLCTAMAVSYTHLDVYKRQGGDEAADAHPGFQRV